MEVDVGVLGPGEEKMLPRDEYRQSEEAWVEFSLRLARGCRMRMEKMTPGTPDYNAEGWRREMALESARSHLGNLWRRGYIVPSWLAAAMQAEGL